MELLYSLIHSAVNIFAGGRSDIKVILFFVYVLVLLVAALWRPLKLPSKLQHPGFNLPVAILSLLAIAYGAGLASFLLLYRTYGLSLRSFIVVFNNNEISSTMLLHSHVFKGAIGLVLNWFHLGVQENVDTGLAFVHLVPPVLLYGVLLVALLLCAVFFLYFMSACPSASRGYRILYALTFAIISFSLVKNIFDGGALNRETPVALSGLLLLVWPHRAVLYKIVIPLLGGYALLVFALWRMGGFTTSELGQIVIHLVAYTCLLSALIYLLHWPRPRWRTWGLLTCLFLVVGVSIYFDTMPLLQLRAILVTPAQPAVIGSYRPIHGPEYTEIERIGNLMIYRYQPIIPTKVGTLLDRHDLLDNLAPITVPGRTCFFDRGWQEIGFDALTPNQAQGLPQRFQTGRLTSIKLVGLTANGWHHYRVWAALSPCSPRPLNVLQGLLSSEGITTFIFTNPTSIDPASSYLHDQ